MAASTDTVTVGWILGWWLGMLIRIDYDVIGHLAGIAGETANQYAHRGEYDPRNLENVLQWVNGRRAANGGILDRSTPQERSRCRADDLTTQA